jgi:hypothetical protein
MDVLPLYDTCPRCNGSTVINPTRFDDDTWLVCTGCSRQMISWTDYKKRALDHAGGSCSDERGLSGTFASKVARALQRGPLGGMVLQALGSPIQDFETRIGLSTP